MGLLIALEEVITTAGAQLTQTTSKAVKEFHFSNNFQEKAKAYGLSEKDALDVFHHGSVKDDQSKVKKYNGYEIGIWYFISKRSGQPVIHSIWKRGRR
jgi:hypothetical protein